MQKPSVIHTKLSLFLASYVPPSPLLIPSAHPIQQHKSATETDLRREFEGYGTIERVRIVRDRKGRSRGYAFVVYERERDMKGLSFFSFSPQTPA
jgi:RNA recognition motif-containing protein